MTFTTRASVFFQTGDLWLGALLGSAALTARANDYSAAAVSTFNINLGSLSAGEIGDGATLRIEFLDPTDINDFSDDSQWALFSSPRFYNPSFANDLDAVITDGVPDFGLGNVYEAEIDFSYPIPGGAEFASSDVIDFQDAEDPEVGPNSTLQLNFQTGKVTFTPAGGSPSEENPETTDATIQSDLSSATSDLVLAGVWFGVHNLLDDVTVPSSLEVKVRAYFAVRVP